ncbi:MAG TPA: carboxypeptidase-like regulatory domain-containing protein, partial [Thermoanaerobaculia bacterium]|nr:carboxypeptidase-like regulatory domain-containing protein [Thermoanaerobaculia bacterium]
MPIFRGLRYALALSALPLFAPAAFAFEGRLLLPDGAAAAGFEVSVVGRASAALTDSDGGFSIAPDPAVPFELIAIGPGGQVSPPVRIESLSASDTLDVTLAATFRETITVATGVAAEIEAPPAAALLTIAQENLEQRRPERLVDALDGVAGVVKSDESLAGVPSLRGQAR